MKTFLNLRKSPILTLLDVEVPLWLLMIIHFLLGGGEQLDLLEIANIQEYWELEENAINGFLSARPGQSIVGTFVPMIGGDRFIPARERAFKWFSLAGVVGTYNIKAKIRVRGETPILSLVCYDEWDFNGPTEVQKGEDCSNATMPILLPLPLPIPFPILIQGTGWTLKQEGIYLSEALLTKLNSRRFKTLWKFDLEEWELGFPFDRIQLKGDGSYVEFK